MGRVFIHTNHSNHFQHPHICAIWFIWSLLLNKLVFSFIHISKVKNLFLLFFQIYRNNVYLFYEISFYIYKSQWKIWRKDKFLTTYYQTNSEILGGCRCSINHKISNFYRNERCKKLNENCPIGSHKKYRTNYFYIFNIAYTPVSL